MAEVLVVSAWHKIEYYHRTIDGVKGQQFECACGWRSALSKHDSEIRPAAHEHLKDANRFIAFIVLGCGPLPKVGRRGTMFRGTGEEFKVDGED